jgi:hypothetical protein
MTALTKSASSVLLLLCSTAAILMTFTGLLFLVGVRLAGVFAHSEKFTGEIDAISIALVFGGIAAALKTIEVRLRAKEDLPID